MKTMLFLPRMLSSLLIFMVVAIPVRGTADTFLTLATGPLNSATQAAGKAICNAAEQDPAIARCRTWRSAGSGANLDLIRSGMADMAVIQSDVAIDRIPEDVSHVLRLHRHYLAVVVRGNDKAMTLSDVRYNRLHTGSAGSDHRLSAVIIATILRRGVGRPAATPSDLVSPPICGGTARGLLLMAGLPSAMVQEAILSCGGRLVGLDDPTIERLTTRNPAYDRAIIPALTYRGQQADIATIAQDTLIVARNDVPEDVIRAVLASVRDDLDRIRAAHPALANLSWESMTKPTTTLPTHPGAKAYHAKN